MAKPKTPKIGTRVKVAILPSSDAKESVELDYRLLIPGNFSRSEPGSQGMVKDRRLRTIGRKGDFQKILKDINPQLKLTVPNKLSDEPEAEMEVNLDIKDMKDFHPDEIVNQVEPMKQLLEAREKLKQLKLQVLKDVKFRKAIESVLQEGSGSVDDLMSKLAAGEAEAEKEAPKK
jgi:type VI secretion system protein ImpB